MTTFTKRFSIPVALLLFLFGGSARAQEIERNFAGSVQLNYMAIATDLENGRKQTLDGSTVELSMKLAVDFGDNLSANVKVCVACHGLETGMALFDAKLTDEIYLRLGRFTPAFGEFPIRHDPANHQTSDKPLPYDMGRMLRLREWNMSILPTPWVDNGFELSGNHIFGDHVLDWALYAIGGPRASADPFDFDFIQSRNGAVYYIDNNSQPSVGARLAGTFGITDNTIVSLGFSGMAGHYDPDGELSFVILGSDVVLRLHRLVLRAEYLVRRTAMALGDNPESRFRYGRGSDGYYDNFFLKEGFYTEAEYPISNLSLIVRWDGMRRRGNVATTSKLRSDSAILRYTAGLSYELWQGFRLKSSVEAWDFSDFDDEIAVHLGIAGLF